MNLSKAALMLLVVILGIAYYWRYEIPVSQEATGEAAPLALLAKEEVKLISFQRKDGYFAIEKKDQPDRLQSYWAAMDPADALVDEQVVNKLLEAVTPLKIGAKISAAEKKDEERAYGLNPAELVVTFSSSSGEKRLKFGDLNLISGRRYLEIEGDDNLYLIDSLRYREFDLLPGQIRQTRPYFFNSAEVSEIIVTPFGRASQQFVKEKDGNWTLFSSAGAVLPDADIVAEALKDLTEFQVSKFMDIGLEQKSVYGLEPADYVVEVRFVEQKSKPLRFLFGVIKRPKVIDKMRKKEIVDMQNIEYETDYYTKLEQEPWIYKMSNPLFRAFTKEPKEYLIKEAFRSLPSSGPLQLSWKKDNQELHLERRADGQWLAKNHELVINSGAVESYLETVRKTALMSYLPREMPDKAAPEKFSLEIRASETEAGYWRIAIGQNLERPDGNVGVYDQPPYYAQVQAPRVGVVSAIIAAEQADSIMKDIIQRDTH